MKIIKLMTAFLFVFALVLPVQVLGQCADTNGDGVTNADDYPVGAPGEGQGCGDYDDCNGNGAYDAGEPCHEGGDHPTGKSDHPTGGGDDPTGKGDHPTSKGDHPTSKGDHPTGKGDHPTGKSDHPSGEAESEHEEDCAPRNDYHANCGAICAGMTEYWVDRDGDCEAEDGPFATWSEPTCPACPDDDH